MNMRGKEGKGKPDSCRWNTRAIHLNHSTYFQSFSLGNVIPRYQFADEKFRLRILVRSIEYKFKREGGKKRRRTLVPKWINKFQIKFTQKENKKFREEFIPIFVRIQRFLVVLDTMQEYIYIYIYKWNLPIFPENVLPRIVHLRFSRELRLSFVPFWRTNLSLSPVMGKI